MWVNLPQKDKMIKPRYQDYQPDSIPVVTLQNGIKIKVMAGDSNGVKGGSSFFLKLSHNFSSYLYISSISHLIYNIYISHFN